jgi:hypothetical protein
LYQSFHWKCTAAIGNQALFPVCYGYDLYSCPFQKPRGTGPKATKALKGHFSFIICNTHTTTYINM